MSLGKLYGVGVGPGDPGLLTLRSIEVFRSVDIIFTVEGPKSPQSVSRSLVDTVDGVQAEKCGLLFSMALDSASRTAAVERNADIVQKELEAGRNCAFAVIGDAATYSTFGYVMKILIGRLPELEVVMVPGVTSFAALASKGRMLLVEDDEVLRVFPGHGSDVADEIDFPSGTTTVVLKTYKTRNALIRKARTVPGVQILYGSRIGLENEFVTSDASEAESRQEEYLSLLIVKSP